ncbi:MAG TPA: hypothetical protein VKK79_14180 [Candidatus Lokiarchaeia archaeon]|nr:hypothetical protein [Candidatus Lokiarchaeia archaeon]
MENRNIFAIVGYIPLSFQDFEKAIFSAEFWERVSPVSKISASFPNPNVLEADVEDAIQVDPAGIAKIPLEIHGELVFEYKGEDGSKGHLYEVYARNNNYLNSLEARLRVKPEGARLKVGIFLQSLELNSMLFQRGLGKDAVVIALKLKMEKLLRNFKTLAEQGKIFEE